MKNNSPSQLTKPFLSGMLNDEGRVGLSGSPMKRQEVLLKLQQHYQELALHFGVTALFLFGSVARDEARPDSDVDLLVEFGQPIGLFEFIELQQQLESILECKVDLGTRRSLKPRIKNQVLQEAIRVA
jgi:uncharacterized protein